MPGSTKEEDRAKESCFKNSIKYTASLSCLPHILAHWSGSRPILPYLVQRGPLH